MVKIEITKFKIQCSEQIYECAIPFTVESVLSAHGALAQAPVGDVSFVAEVFTDSSALMANNIYLKFSSNNLSFKLYVNGEYAGECDAECQAPNFNIKSYLVAGTNTLTVKPTGSDSPSSLGLLAAPELLRFGSAIIDRVSATQAHGRGEVTVTIKTDIIGNPSNVRAVATLVSSTGQIYYSGLTHGRGSITVKDPLYWWPHGLGVQNLYKLTVNLYGDSEIEDTRELKIGLRTVITSKSTDGAVLEINGARFLPMGAVYNVDERIDPRTFAKKTEAQLTSIAMAGFNSLVIPLGSHRPTEQFYELCDVHGIVVIEEVESLGKSALDSLIRRSNHPSLGLIDIVNAGERIGMLADALHRELPGLEFSISERQTEYPSCHSLPSDKTLLSAIAPDEMNLFSRSVEKLAGEDNTVKMLLSAAKRYPYASSLSDFAYLSRLAAANEIADKMTAARLAGGDIGRAIFSGIGEDRVCAGASSLDSHARWKALQYYSARFFEPLMAVARCDSGKVSFYISNEQRIPFSGTIEYRIQDSKNQTVYKNVEPCAMDSTSAKKVMERDLSEYITGHENEYYLEYFLKENNSVFSHRTLLFVPEKHFSFQNPNIRAEIVGSDHRFSITLTADAFAKDVELDFGTADAVFKDNCFDITSSAPIKISFTVTGAMETTYSLRESLKIRTIYDVKH